MVILDTSLIIDHLRQGSSGSTKLEKIAKKEGKDSLAISVITLQELYEGKSTRNDRKLGYMLSVLGPLKIFDYSMEVAELAGILARDSKISMEFADVAIAATCIFNGFPLYTLNLKYFKDMPDLELYSLE